MIRNRDVVNLTHVLSFADLAWKTRKGTGTTFSFKLARKTNKKL
jgi:hypothetical protein